MNCSLNIPKKPERQKQPMPIETTYATHNTLTHEENITVYQLDCHWLKSLVWPEPTTPNHQWAHRQIIIALSDIMGSRRIREHILVDSISSRTARDSIEIPANLGISAPSSPSQPYTCIESTRKRIINTCLILFHLIRFVWLAYTVRRRNVHSLLTGPF